MIPIKTSNEINAMREAGALAAQVLEMIEPYVKPGVSTLELDTICHDYMIEHQCIPATLGYHGFPSSICTSVNHVICHGIPSKDVRLKQGDIINIDVTVILNGFHGDTSRTYYVGSPSPAVQKLCHVTQQAMYAGIELVRPGVRLGDIGHRIASIGKEHGYGVVREYTGHGIGRKFHEEPAVFHWGKPGTGETLLEGMCLTIEPMFNLGTHECRVLSDKWTVVTKDRKHSAQYEHTIAVTESGYEILTFRQEEEGKIAPKTQTKSILS